MHQKSDQTQEPEYLQVLNEQQREAVLECSAPLLVLAGAGSGKTRVITTKIVHLIETLNCRPWSILAVTFTNKAAAEMKERVLSMVDGAEDVYVKTFHSFGAWLLRRFADRLDLADNFTIYDDDDSLTLLHSLYPNYKRTELKPYTRAISRAKDFCLSPKDDLTEIHADTRFPDMYAAYDKKLRAIGNADFGDLIFRAVELLRDNEDIRDHIQSRFRAILVDEYQDSNVAQYQLLKQMTGQRTFICVVGDDDQSIYRFRGAELRNILTFPETFPGTKTIRLEENYRSTGNILKIAETVVSNNLGRHGKQLWTRKGEGEKAHLKFFDDQFAEARYCADLVDSDSNYDGTAILYRTNAQSAAFETVFMRMNIPYKVVGALRFFDREEVKDALAILSLIQNPADEVAFRRIINKPSRGIGDASLTKILDTAAQEGGNCRDGLQKSTDLLKGRARQGALDFLEWYSTAVDKLEGSDLAEFTRSVLNASGIIEYHRKQDEIALTQKVNNLEELVNAAGAYPPGARGLAEFLESLELDSTVIGKQDPADKPGVTLITMHNTKGLEFERVIITGLEEGLFPGRANESDEDIEEERRIFYVSITRAKRQLYLTSCRQRFIWGRSSYQTPSRFLREVPKECMLGDRFPAFGSEFADYSHQEESGYKFSGNGYPGFGKQIDAERMAGSRPKITRKSDAYFRDQESRNTNQAAGQDKPAGKFSQDEISVGKFSSGDRVYHDEYGSGYITESNSGSGREVVTVRFDTGRSAKFITKYARLEKIAQD